MSFCLVQSVVFSGVQDSDVLQICLMMGVSIRTNRPRNWFRVIFQPPPPPVSVSPPSARVNRDCGKAVLPTRG